MEEEDVKCHLDFLCYCMKKSYLGQIQCVDTKQLVLSFNESFGNKVDGCSPLSRRQGLETSGAGTSVLGHYLNGCPLVVSAGEERSNLKYNTIFNVLLLYLAWQIYPLKVYLSRCIYLLTTHDFPDSVVFHAVTDDDGRSVL